MTRRRVALGVVAIVCVLLVGALMQHLAAPGSGPIVLPIAVPVATSVPTPTPQQSAPPTPRTIVMRPLVWQTADDARSMAVAVAPTVDAAVVDALLAREGSPLAGLGRYIVAAGRRWGIDPVFLAAFVAYFDVPDPVPPSAHNVGHIRAIAGQPSMDGYRVFPDWQAGIDAWYRLVAGLYVRRWHLASLDSIIPVYAPGSGRRSVEAELNSLRATVDALRGLTRA